MTRRGSLAYYLAAWICGTVFMSICVWAREIFFGGGAEPNLPKQEAMSLLFICFYGLLLGAVAAFVSAYLLRTFMKWFSWRGTLQWIVSGAIITTLVILALGYGGLAGSGEQLLKNTAMTFVSLGPAVVISAGWWLATPAGAATAYVLHRIDRAFAPPAATPSAE
jgi:hypothetical protein